MTDAEKLYTQVFTRCNRLWSFILSFRITANQGMPGAKERIWAEKTDFVSNLMHNPDNDKLFTDKAGFFKAHPPEKLIEFMTNETVNQAQIGIDAASIVFAHSTLDGAAFDYCRVTALVAPRDWESVMDQRQIRLSDARESGYDQILTKKLEGFFEQFERESLLKKADHLFARCKPPDKWSPMHNYAFDRARLERLDRYRHEVIHGEGLGKAIPAAEEEVEYLMKTAIFSMSLVNLRYKLMMDPYYAFTGHEVTPAKSGSD